VLDEENVELVDLFALKLKRKRTKKKRQFWVRSIFQKCWQQRTSLQILQELGKLIQICY